MSLEFDLVIVGLGNPGDQYANTRHNLGFCFVDFIARAASERENLKAPYLKADMSGAVFKEFKLLLVKPLSYMNQSGTVLLALKDRFESDLSKFLVVYDDLDIPLGTLRLRKRGSAGTHRGMASIVNALGSEDFPRLRLGIGPKPMGTAAEDFVLERFSKRETPAVEAMLLKAKEVVEKVLEKGLDYTVSVGQKRSQDA